MLSIELEGTEWFDEESGQFITVPPQTIQLEHSLVSISKWESKWHKPFLHTQDKTDGEVLDYICCMSPDDSMDFRTALSLSKENVEQIVSYIENPMTATTFYEPDARPSREIITSEIIYYWMVTLGIPFECQHWHLNRLLTLIKVISLKNEPEKKMSQREINARNKALNEARRKKLNTKG